MAKLRQKEIDYVKKSLKYLQVSSKSIIFARSIIMHKTAIDC